MSVEENKAVVRRNIEEVWNRGNLSVIDEIVAENFVLHDPSQPDPIRGPEGYKQFVTMMRNAFPDLETIIDDLIAEGDTIAVRLTFRGTHTGELAGIPPTGKHVTFTGMSFKRFEGGKYVESFINADDLGLMQQLGVISLPGS